MYLLEDVFNLTGTGQKNPGGGLIHLLPSSFVDVVINLLLFLCHYAQHHDGRRFKFIWGNSFNHTTLSFVRSDNIIVLGLKVRIVFELTNQAVESPSTKFQVTGNHAGAVALSSRAMRLLTMIW